MMLLRPHWPPLGALHDGRTTLTKMLTLIRTRARARVHRHKCQECHAGAGKVTRELGIVQLVRKSWLLSHFQTRTPPLLLQSSSNPLLPTHTSS